MYGLGKCKVSIFNIILAWAGIYFDVSSAAELKPLTLQGFLPMTGSGWPGGGACLPAVMMALRDVNAREGLLDGYNLTYTWVDTQVTVTAGFKIRQEWTGDCRVLNGSSSFLQCKAGLATFQMLEALKVPPTKIMLLGCGCSTAAEATAQVSYLYNLTQLAYGASSPTLSDRKRFPNFFRVSGPDQKLNPAKIALMREFNWRKVATINQALEFFSLVIDDFVKRVQGTDIKIITQEIFQHDPITRVENLKNRDARIVVTACYEDKARLMLCEAYKIGLYGPKIVWIFAAWYSAQFWRHDLDDVPCTEEEMDIVADGAFIIGTFYRNPIVERGIAGITVPEFETLYKQEETYDPDYIAFEFVAAKCYDHVWVAALALNCTDKRLRDIGHSKTIGEFDYSDGDINDIIMSCMSNISIVGVVGSLSFEGDADPISNVQIERIQENKRTFVGTYIMDKEPMHFTWHGDGIIWKGGHIPRDSTYVIHEEVSVPLSLYVTMMSCAAIGILLAVSFFVFNVIHRNNRIVKLSSPNINNVLLFGCILTYCTVFLKTPNSNHSALCKARTFCFCVGFTTAFGALFSKTWRVYKIFTNKKLLKMTIKDYQLIGMVCALCGIIIIILIAWEIMGPQVLITKQLIKDVYVVGNDAEIRPFVRVCHSEYGVHFSWTLYIIEGVLLAFGAFLAFESRHVKIEALNDSHQIGMCLYNVVVLSAVGLTFTLLLEEKVVMIYGIVSACVILGTTLTQTIVFIPKVLAVYGNNSSIQPVNGSRGGSSTLTGNNQSAWPSIGVTQQSA